MLSQQMQARLFAQGTVPVPPRAQPPQNHKSLDVSTNAGASVRNNAFFSYELLKFSSGDFCSFKYLFRLLKILLGLAEYLPTLNPALRL
jgi:hypothetical protein